MRMCGAKCSFIFGDEHTEVLEEQVVCLLEKGHPGDHHISQTRIVCVVAKRWRSHTTGGVD